MAIFYIFTMQRYYGNSRSCLQLNACGEIEEEQYIEVARIGGEDHFERFTYLLLQSFQTVKGLKALQYKWCFLKTHKQTNIILLPYKQLRYSLRWQLWPATEDYKDFITSFSHPHQLH